MKYPKARLRGYSLITTILLIVVISISVYVTLLEETLRRSNLIGLLIVAGGTIVALLLLPRSYTMDKNDIVISRLVFPITIKRRDIKKIYYDANRFYTSGLTRVFGVGGFWGYYGYFFSKNLGTISVHATDLGKCVVIETTKKVYVITPDNPQLFVDDYENK